MESNICPECKHSLKDNEHGPDQNDFIMEEDNLTYLGSCTYCKECNPPIPVKGKKK
jgi:hypothetical protein